MEKIIIEHSFFGQADNFIAIGKIPRLKRSVALHVSSFPSRKIPVQPVQHFKHPA